MHYKYPSGFTLRLWVVPIGFPPRKVTIGTAMAGVILTKGHGEDERQQVHMR